MPLSPFPRLTLILGTIVLVPLIALGVMSVFATAAGLPYPSAIPLGEAIRAALGTPLSRALQDFGAIYITWVLPGVLLAWILYIALRKRRRLRRAVPAACFIAAVIPAGPGAIFGLVCGPSIVGMLAGTVDGEFYSEGWGCHAALGGIMYAAIAVAILEAMRLPAAPGHCPVCQYDRRDLPPGSPCPECGSDRPPVSPPPPPLSAHPDNPYASIP